MPMLAGIPVTDDDTQTLAELLRHGEFPHVADKLERGLALGTRVFALTIVDRESIFAGARRGIDRRAR